MAPIRVGIIGISTNVAPFSAGSWGARAHLPGLKALPAYEVVALANSTVESAKKSIEFHGLPASTKAYGSPEDLAKDPDVDLVVVSVQVGKHYQLAKPALQHGKDVFVEWPLGASLAESEELTELAAAKGVRTLVGLQAFPDPVVVKMKSILESGQIGRITSTTVRGCSSVFALEAWIQGAEYYLDIMSGGNEFSIFFGHFLGSFVDILGDFASMQAFLKADTKSMPIMNTATGEIVETSHPKTSPDHILIQGELKSGAVASIIYRRAKSPVDEKGVSWVITGTEGELEISAAEGQWQYSTVKKSLKLKIGKGEVQDVDCAEIGEVAPTLADPAKGTARLYEQHANNSSLVLPTFERALKAHRLLNRIAETAGWKAP